MKKLAADIEALLAHLGAHNEEAADALKYEHVNHMWETAVNAVFGQAAPLVLDHTNTVYIMSAEQGRELRRIDRPRSMMNHSFQGNVVVVYSDDSTVRSEIDARQQLLAMKCREAGENIEGIIILPSTSNMKARHPFRHTTEPGQHPAAEQVKTHPLTPEEQSEVERASSTVEDDKLREAVRKAIAANFELKEE